MKTPDIKAKRALNLAGSSYRSCRISPWSEMIGWMMDREKASMWDKLRAWKNLGGIKDFVSSAGQGLKKVGEEQQECINNEVTNSKCMVQYLTKRSANLGKTDIENGYDLWMMSKECSADVDNIMEKCVKNAYGIQGTKGSEKQGS